MASRPAEMTPRGEFSSTGYALASPGSVAFGAPFPAVL